MVTPAMAGPESIDVVVRFHDPARLPELNRCVFSLVNQTYRPLRIILTTQRFSEADLAVTRAALAPLLAGEDGVTLSVVNWTNPDPADARSVLLNIGVADAAGRYLAFLDYDDVLYPDAYERLIGRLQSSHAAIAFASVRTIQLQAFARFFHQARKLAPLYAGRTLMDLFRNNFCPLHSYVIDRTQVAPELLQFTAALLMEEDYDVLLRICARYASDFALIGTEIGDYYSKTDGSNTVLTQGALSPEAEKHYREARLAIEHRKRITLVTEAVQRALHLPPSPRPVTVRDLVDRYA